MIKPIRLLPLRHNIRYTDENTNQEHHVPRKNPPHQHEDEKRIRVIKTGPYIVSGGNPLLNKRDPKRCRGILQYME